MNKIYLDNNASTPCDLRVFEIFKQVETDTNIANPYSSEHYAGWNAEKKIEEAKEIISSFINGFSQEIVFTSGSTEANNLAIIGVAITAKNNNINKNKIILSSIEHKCVVSSANFLKNFFGFEIVVLPVDKSGIIDLNFLERCIDEQTLLVSVMSTNNEIGTYQPINDIGMMCRENGVVFHVDATQSAYMDIDVLKNNIDFLSMSGHKIYAPKGIGFLYINDDASIKPSPIIYGGEQQNGFRSGTISPSLCSAMAKAVELIKDNKDNEINHLKSLRDLFLSELKKSGIAFSINGDMEKRHPGNLNLKLKNVDAKTLIMRLQPSVAISTGSACSSGNIEPSYVLRAMGLSKDDASSSVRISFGRFNTKDDVIFAAQKIAEEANKIVEQ